MCMQPNLYNGTFYFRSDHDEHYPELMRQLINYPLVQNDDFPDIIEKAVTYLQQFAGSTIHNYQSKSILEKKSDTFVLKNNKVAW